MDQFNEMRRDLVFKQQQTSQAQFTSDRLKNKGNFELVDTLRMQILFFFFILFLSLMHPSSFKNTIVPFLYRHIVEFAEVLRELESIENIESKIEVQTRYFTDKMKTMQQEMHKYEDLNSLRTDAQRNRRVRDLKCAQRDRKREQGNKGA